MSPSLVPGYPDGNEVKIFGDGRCAVCPKTTREGRLMCGRHWREVPEELRRDVYRAFHGWRNRKGTLEELRTAQMAAITSVEIGAK